MPRRPPRPGPARRAAAASGRRPAIGLRASRRRAGRPGPSPPRTAGRTRARPSCRPGTPRPPASATISTDQAPEARVPQPVAQALAAPARREEVQQDRPAPAAAPSSPAPARRRGPPSSSPAGTDDRGPSAIFSTGGRVSRTGTLNRRKADGRGRLEQVVERRPPRRGPPGHHEAEQSFGAAAELHDPQRRIQHEDRQHAPEQPVEASAGGPRNARRSRRSPGRPPHPTSQCSVAARSRVAGDRTAAAGIGSASGSSACTSRRPGPGGPDLLRHGRDPSRQRGRQRERLRDAQRQRQQPEQGQRALRGSPSGPARRTASSRIVTIRNASAVSAGGNHQTAPPKQSPLPSTSAMRATASTRSVAARILLPQFHHDGVLPVDLRVGASPRPAFRAGGWTDACRPSYVRRWPGLPRPPPRHRPARPTAGRRYTP